MGSQATRIMKSYTILRIQVSRKKLRHVGVYGLDIRTCSSVSRLGKSAGSPFSYRGFSDPVRNPFDFNLRGS